MVRLTMLLACVLVAGPEFGVLTSEFGRSEVGSRRSEFGRPGSELRHSGSDVGWQDGRTTWDGVYSDEQAQRGAALYGEKCGQCHGDTLGGVESAPALTGPAFYGNWEGQPLDNLFERIRTSMPLDNPGSLSRAQNADILAHLLQVGGYPAGAAALEGQAAALTPITILTFKP